MEILESDRSVFSGTIGLYTLGIYGPNVLYAMVEVADHFDGFPMDGDLGDLSPNDVI